MGLSNYFREVIFPSKPKVVDEEISEYGELKWWCENHDEVIYMMVSCPICGEKYRYSIMQVESNMIGMYAGILDNESYFRREWAQDCPKNACHANLISMLAILGTSF